MERPDPISQDDVFYGGGWTRDIESVVLMKLDFERWSGNWIVGDRANNERCMRIIRQEVNSEMGVDLSVDSYIAKLSQWSERTDQFSWLLDRPGVRYFIASNIVEASDIVWVSIARRRPNLRVYMLRGEACWSQLRRLFRQVIDLSSTSSLSIPRTLPVEDPPVGNVVIYGGLDEDHRAQSPSLVVFSEGSESHCASEVVDKP